MENNRPRSREKNVTGPGKKVEKYGKGLGTGPVGDAGGYADRRRQEPSSSGTRSAGTRSGGGGLIGKNDGAWLAVNGQPVAYYHTSTVDDGVNYTITGRVPVLYNDSRAELILVFDNENPHGFAAGVQSVYLDGETDTAAKLQAELQPGDTLAFLCDYHSYAGDYQDSYLLGEPLTVTEEGLTVTDVPLEGRTRAAYRFTDLYGQHHWTPVIPEA